MQKRSGRAVKYYSPKRRAVYALGDEINHLLVFELFNWTCWVCRKPIDRHVRKPNHWAATLEHITPLCLGGTHTWDNITVSHAICNFSKGGAGQDTLGHGTIEASDG